MSDSTTADRTAPRIETAITPESASHFFLRADGNLGADGVFIATDRELAVGDRVGVELSLHSYVLFFRGTVRWRSAAGIGVSFDDISGAARRVIESFCERRRPPVHYEHDGAPVERH
jgi:hypothetical protein